MQRIEIAFKPSFLRDFKKLEKNIQADAREKIELFKNVKNHEQLRVHKLTGKLKSYYSFSVTYSHRIVFIWEDKETAVFLGIGDHSIYN